MTEAKKVAMSFIAKYPDRLWPDRDQSQDPTLRDAIAGYVLPLMATHAVKDDETEEQLRYNLRGSDGQVAIRKGNWRLKEAKSEPNLVHVSRTRVDGDLRKLFIEKEGSGEHVAQEDLAQGISGLGLNPIPADDLQDSAGEDSASESDESSKEEVLCQMCKKVSFPGISTLQKHQEEECDGYERS